MPAVGVSLFQVWAEAHGSWVESLSFSLENLPGLDASGVVALNTLVNQLDPGASTGPPEAAGFLLGWQTDEGYVEADPQFWGAFTAHRLRRLDLGVTCIQARAKWTFAVELWQ